MNKTLLKRSTVLLSSLSTKRCVSYVPRKRNYYEVLGIEKTATLDEVKRAFAAESRKLHPDSRGSKPAPNSTEKFMELKEAYDFLRKPQKRAEYDRELEFSRVASRDMFYENPGSDYETINLNVRGPGGGLHRSQHPPIKPSRFGHFFDPTKEMEREKQNDKFWRIFVGAVLLIIVGNILYVSFYMTLMQRFIRCYSAVRQSHYEVLGLSKTATADEIKKAFYTLSKKYHPDITGENEAATKKFVAVKEAYDTLRDPDKRQMYDNQMSGGFPSYGSSNQGYQSNPYQSGGNPFQAGGNPFQNNQFEQKWKNGRWEFTYRRSNPTGQTFTQDDFERIWREFQRKTQDPRNASYDNMFKEHRQRVWDDFSKARAEAWRKRSEEHAKKYPFDNMQFNPSLYINWEKFNKWIIIYVVVFFIIGVLQSMWKSGEENEPKRKQRAVYSERPYEPTPRERLQEMIYRPPTSESTDNTPWYEDRPPSGRPPGI